MIAVLEAMADSATEELYQAELDSLLNKQDSLLRAPRVQKKIVTHRNTYTIHHKKKDSSNAWPRYSHPEKTTPPR